MRLHPFKSVESSDDGDDDDDDDDDSQISTVPCSHVFRVSFEFFVLLWFLLNFYMRDAMLAWFLRQRCVRLSVRLSHAGIVPIRAKAGS